MEREQVKTALIQILQSIPEAIGETCPQLTGQTKPLAEIPKFDSKLGILATAKLARQLDVHIPDNANIFVDKKTKAKLTIDQTVALVCKFASTAIKKDAAA